MRSRVSRDVFQELQLSMQRREVETDAFFKGKKVLPDHLQLAGRQQQTIP